MAGAGKLGVMTVLDGCRVGDTTVTAGFMPASRWSRPPSCSESDMGGRAGFLDHGWPAWDRTTRNGSVF